MSGRPPGRSDRERAHRNDGGYERHRPPVEGSGWGGHLGGLGPGPLHPPPFGGPYPQPPFYGEGGPGYPAPYPPGASWAGVHPPHYSWEAGAYMPPQQQQYPPGQGPYDAHHQYYASAAQQGVPEPGELEEGEAPPLPSGPPPPAPGAAGSASAAAAAPLAQQQDSSIEAGEVILPATELPQATAATTAEQEGSTPVAAAGASAKSATPSSKQPVVIAANKGFKLPASVAFRIDASKRKSGRPSSRAKQEAAKEAQEAAKVEGMVAELAAHDGTAAAEGLSTQQQQEREQEVTAMVAAAAAKAAELARQRQQQQQQHAAQSPAAAAALSPAAAAALAAAENLKSRHLGAEAAVGQAGSALPAEPGPARDTVGAEAGEGGHRKQRAKTRWGPDGGAKLPRLSGEGSGGKAGGAGHILSKDTAGEQQQPGSGKVPAVAGKGEPAAAGRTSGGREGPGVGPLGPSSTAVAEVARGGESVGAAAATAERGEAAATNEGSTAEAALAAPSALMPAVPGGPKALQEGAQVGEPKLAGPADTPRAGDRERKERGREEAERGRGGRDDEREGKERGREGSANVASGREGGRDGARKRGRSKSRSRSRSPRDRGRHRSPSSSQSRSRSRSRSQSRSRSRSYYRSRSRSYSRGRGRSTRSGRSRSDSYESGEAREERRGSGGRRSREGGGGRRSRSREREKRYRRASRSPSSRRYYDRRHRSRSARPSGARGPRELPQGPSRLGPTNKAAQHAQHGQQAPMQAQAWDGRGEQRRDRDWERERDRDRHRDRDRDRDRSREARRRDARAGAGEAALPRQHSPVRRHDVHAVDEAGPSRQHSPGRRFQEQRPGSPGWRRQRSLSLDRDARDPRQLSGSPAPPAQRSKWDQRAAPPPHDAQHAQQLPPLAPAPAPEAEGAQGAARPRQRGGRKYNRKEARDAAGTPAPPSAGGPSPGGGRAGSASLSLVDEAALASPPRSRPPSVGPTPPSVHALKYKLKAPDLTRRFARLASCHSLDLAAATHAQLSSMLMSMLRYAAHDRDDQEACWEEQEGWVHTLRGGEPAEAAPFSGREFYDRVPDEVVTAEPPPPTSNIPWSPLAPLRLPAALPAAAMAAAGAGAETESAGTAAPAEAAGTAASAGAAGAAAPTETADTAGPVSTAGTAGPAEAAAAAAGGAAEQQSQQAAQQEAAQQAPLAPDASAAPATPAAPAAPAGAPVLADPRLRYIAEYAAATEYYHKHPQRLPLWAESKPPEEAQPSLSWSQSPKHLDWEEVASRAASFPQTMEPGTDAIDVPHAPKHEDAFRSTQPAEVAPLEPEEGFWQGVLPGGRLTEQQQLDQLRELARRGKLAWGWPAYRETDQLWVPLQEATVSMEDVLWPWHSVAQRAADPQVAAASLLSIAAAGAARGPAQAGNQPGQSATDGAGTAPGVAAAAVAAEQAVAAKGSGEDGREMKEEEGGGKEAQEGEKEGEDALRAWLNTTFSATAGNAQLRSQLASEAKEAALCVPTPIPRVVRPRLSGPSAARAPAVPASPQAWFDAAGRAAARSWGLAGPASQAQQAQHGAKLARVWGAAAPLCIATAVRGSMLQKEGSISKLRDVAKQVLGEVFWGEVRQQEQQAARKTQQGQQRQPHAGQRHERRPGEKRPRQQ